MKVKPDFKAAANKESKLAYISNTKKLWLKQLFITAGMRHDINDTFLEPQ